MKTTDRKPLEDLDRAVPLESVQDSAAFGQVRRGRRDVDEERPSPYELDRLAAEPARGHCATIEWAADAMEGPANIMAVLKKERWWLLAGAEEIKSKSLR